MDLTKTRRDKSKGWFEGENIATIKIPHHLCAVMVQIMHNSNIKILYLSVAGLGIDLWGSLHDLK